MTSPLPIAVLGAGLAGIACARALRDGGATVRLLDKGRAAGGRLASRRAETPEGAALRFDHGAQYLTARGPAFAAALREAEAAPWPDPGRFVGVPGMSALPRHLARDLPILFQRHAAALEPAPGGAGWMVLHLDARQVRADRPVPPEALAAAERDGPFAAVALTLPAPQAAPLLARHAPAVAAGLAEQVRLAPCWTLMAAFAERLPLPDTLRPEDGGPIGWAARDSSKPGRDPEAECWVVQAGPAWSRAHLEDPAEAVTLALLDALAGQAGAALPPPRHAAAHRWRHAMVETPLGQPCLWDPALRLGLAGDWCLAARAEAAFDSGAALAAAILASA
jgi:predicted NAD/FAD-dependent oxidoreductase